VSKVLDCKIFFFLHLIKGVVARDGRALWALRADQGFLTVFLSNLLRLAFS
jgi:hypothetical protein